MNAIEQAREALREVREFAFLSPRLKEVVDAALAALDQEGGARKAGGVYGGVTAEHWRQAILQEGISPDEVEKLANDLARGG